MLGGRCGLWKNKGNGKILDGMYYCSFEIKGLNLDRLIETFKKRGIVLYNVRKLSNKKLQFTSNSSDSEKIFAISKELCYNIKKLGHSGKFYPLVFLARNLGILIGAVVFIVGGYVNNDYILGISYTGSATEYRREVEEFLKDKGITTFTKFSAFNNKVLASEIMGNSPHFSFVSCEKRGNWLQIDLAIQEEGKGGLTGKQGDLYSTFSGEIEEIKVYRGRAMVSAGDSVKKGDLLVSSTVTVGDKELQINVIACITVKTVINYQFVSFIDNELDAVAFALGKASDKAVIDYTVIKKEVDGEYYYDVTLICRQVIYAG